MVFLLANGKLDICQAILLIRMVSAKPLTTQFLLFTLMIMVLKKVHFTVGSEY